MSDGLLRRMAPSFLLSSDAGNALGRQDALSPGPASTRGAGVLSRISHPSVLTLQPPGPMHTHSGLNVLDRKCGKHTKGIESKVIDPGG